MLKDIVDKEIRTLLIVCDDADFSTVLNGNVYCSLGMTKQVDCVYHSEYVDGNNIRPCYNPMYQNKGVKKIE